MFSKNWNISNLELYIQTKREFNVSLIWDYDTMDKSLRIKWNDNVNNSVCVQCVQ